MTRRKKVRKGRTGRFLYTPEQRDDAFRARVEPCPMSGCWLWLGGVDRAGYSKFSAGGCSNSVAAHRWSYERYRGPIPAGFQIDHLCRVKICVNPDHLEPVTQRENALREWRDRRRLTQQGERQ